MITQKRFTGRELLPRECVSGYCGSGTVNSPRGESRIWEIEMEARQFEAWAIVEVMGHRQFAGFVTEQALGGASFVRVDVPESDGLPAFTKLLGAGSIYAITPCTEETAKAFACKSRQRAFSTYEAPRLPPPTGDRIQDDSVPVCKDCGGPVYACECDTDYDEEPVG